MITNQRMRELAEKFASELLFRLDVDELIETCQDLDMSEEEIAYFGLDVAEYDLEDM